MTSTTDHSVTRKCPFCSAMIGDEIGNDINFIVHLGSPLSAHRQTREWAEYVTALNRI